jgi:hypothetical protein
VWSRGGAGSVVAAIEGLAVITDNLVNIGQALQARQSLSPLNLLAQRTQLRWGLTRVGTIDRLPRVTHFCAGK